MNSLNKINDSKTAQLLTVCFVCLLFALLLNPIYPTGFELGNKLWSLLMFVLTAGSFGYYSYRLIQYFVYKKPIDDIKLPFMSSSEVKDYWKDKKEKKII